MKEKDLMSLSGEIVMKKEVNIIKMKKNQKNKERLAYLHVNHLKEIHIHYLHVNHLEKIHKHLEKAHQKEGTDKYRFGWKIM